MLEANPHSNPWEVIKDLYGWDYLVGWKRDDFTNLEDMLRLLNKPREEVL